MQSTSNNTHFLKTTRKWKRYNAYFDNILYNYSTYTRDFRLAAFVRNVKWTLEKRNTHKYET